MQTNRRSTRRSLLVSATALILSIAMLVGTTFAWFTDTVSSGVNKIQAGNLDIEVYHSATGAPNKTDADKVTDATQLFQMDLWEPGAVVYENFLITNEGTLSLKYALDFNLTTLEKNYVVEKNGDTTTGTERSLEDVLYVKIDNGTVSGARPNYTAADGIRLKNFLADTSKSIDAGALEAGGSKKVSVVVYWPQGENDNQYNLKNGWYSAEGKNSTTNDGKNALYIDLPIVLNATQYTSESDSFDNQYDKFPGTQEPFVKPVSQTSAPVSSNSTTELNTDKGSVVIPADAGLPADTVAHLEVYDVEEANGNLTVTDDQTVVSYQVELLDQNGNKIDLSAVNEKTLLARVEVGYGLDVNRIQVYRDGTTPLTVIKYEDGYVYFESDHFCDVDVVLHEVVARIGNVYYYSYADTADDVAAGAVIDGVVDVDAMEAAIVSKFGATKYVIEKGENKVIVKGAAAVIGTTTYETLEDAISAAQNGDMIALVGDVVSNGLTIQKDVTIELNGKTLNINATDGFMVKNAKLTLQDTSTEQTGTVNHTGSYDLADVSSSGTLAITSGTYTTNGSFGILYKGSNGTSEITGGRFNKDVICASGYDTVLVDGWYVPRDVDYWIEVAAESYSTPVEETSKVVTITTPEELALLAKEVNEGQSYAGYTVRLASDIDLNGKRWTPIGINNETKFDAVFDGQDHTISNLWMCEKDSSNIPYTALIGYATKELKNINFHNVDVYGSTSATLVGTNNSMITDIHITGTIKVVGCCYTGGIAAEGYARIENCSVIADEGSGSCLVADAHDGSNHWSNSGGIRGFTGEGNVVTKDVTVKNMTITAANGGIGGITGNIHYGNTVENALVENCVISCTKNALFGTYVGAIGGRTVNGSTIQLTNVKAINTTVSTSASYYAQNVANSLLIPYSAYNSYATRTAITNIGAIVNGTSYMDFAAAVNAALAVPTGEDNTIYLYGKFSSSALTQEQAQFLHQNNIRIVKSGYSCSVPTISADTGYQYAILDGRYVYVVPTSSEQVVFEYAARNGNKHYTDAGAAIYEAVSGDTVYLKQPTDRVKTLKLGESLTIVSEVEGAVWTGAAADTGLFINTETTGNATTYSTKVNMETAPAKIGETYYPTLQAAFTAMTPEQTIVLLRDVDLDNSVITISKSGALDLNGHKWTTNHGSNGTLYITRSSTIQFSIHDSVGNGEISNTSTGTSNFVNAVEVYNSNATVTISGGTYKTSGGKNYAIYVKGTVNITGGRVEGSCYVYKDSTLTITGGTFTEDPSAYVPGTHHAIQNADGTWTVTERAS